MAPEAPEEPARDTGRMNRWMAKMRQRHGLHEAAQQKPTGSHPIGDPAEGREASSWRHWLPAALPGLSQPGATSRDTISHGSNMMVALRHDAHLTSAGASGDTSLGRQGHDAVGYVQATTAQSGPLARGHHFQRVENRNQVRNNITVNESRTYNTYHGGSDSNSHLLDWGAFVGSWLKWLFCCRTGLIMLAIISLLTLLGVPGTGLLRLAAGTLLRAFGSGFTSGLLGFLRMGGQEGGSATVIVTNATESTAAPVMTPTSFVPDLGTFGSGLDYLDSSLHRLAGHLGDSEETTIDSPPPSLDPKIVAIARNLTHHAHNISHDRIAARLVAERATLYVYLDSLAPQNLRAAARASMLTAAPYLSLWGFNPFIQPGPREFGLALLDLGESLTIQLGEMEAARMGDADALAALMDESKDGIPTVTDPICEAATEASHLLRGIIEKARWRETKESRTGSRGKSTGNGWLPFSGDRGAGDDNVDPSDTANAEAGLPGSHLTPPAKAWMKEAVSMSRILCEGYKDAYGAVSSGIPRLFKEARYLEQLGRDAEVLVGTYFGDESRPEMQAALLNRLTEGAVDTVKGRLAVIAAAALQLVEADFAVIEEPN